MDRPTGYLFFPPQVPGSHRSMLASVPAGYTPQFVHTPTAKAGSVLVYNGQCWHSGGSHPGEPGIGERHSLFAHYRKSCKRSSSLCVFSRSLKEAAAQTASSSAIRTTASRTSGGPTSASGRSSSSA